MKIPFFKMQGFGNDFVMIDCLKEPELPEDLGALAMKVCDRRYGIGADMMVLICKSETADVRIRYFNMSDGMEAQLCGNATRCVTNYLIDHKIFADQKEFLYETLGGAKKAIADYENGEFFGTTIDMGQPEYETEGDDPDTIKKGHLLAGDREFDYYYVSIGNPHCVIYCENVAGVDVMKYGPIIEKHPDFPEGTTVEFVQILDKNHVKCRIWERGGTETTACGSGTCTVCAAGWLTGRTDRELTVHYTGGDIKGFWNPEDNHVYMITGRTEEVFTGTYFLKAT